MMHAIFLFFFVCLVNSSNSESVFANRFYSCDSPTPRECASSLASSTKTLYEAYKTDPMIKSALSSFAASKSAVTVAIENVRKNSPVYIDEIEGAAEGFGTSAEEVMFLAQLADGNATSPKLHSSDMYLSLEADNLLTKERLIGHNDNSPLVLAHGVIHEVVITPPPTPKKSKKKERQRGDEETETEATVTKERHICLTLPGIPCGRFWSLNGWGLVLTINDVAGFASERVGEIGRKVLQSNNISSAISVLNSTHSIAATFNANLGYYNRTAGDAGNACEADCLASVERVEKTATVLNVPEWANKTKSSRYFHTNELIHLASGGPGTGTGTGKTVPPAHELPSLYRTARFWQMASSSAAYVCMESMRSALSDNDGGQNPIFHGLGVGFDLLRGTVEEVQGGKGAAGDGKGKEAWKLDLKTYIDDGGLLNKSQGKGKTGGGTGAALWLLLLVLLIGGGWFAREKLGIGKGESVEYRYIR